MNIKEAKDEIKKTVEIYLDKDAYGNYTIPYMKQRPVFLLGAPGIGKTAIMEQIAEELNLALVSYSMTHHTRQSAIGLPFITERQYGGSSVSVTEYTMSEIVAAVYQMMEKSGKKEGILFLDEINCVSETLAPAMLLFLQYKMFGNHQIPEGWVIVTAGNPPQYNKSVKEFDVATKDRLRCMELQEDFDVWKEYAYKAGVHSAILSFLELNKQWFYTIQETVDGSAYVTARGWEDLSQNIFLYEKKGFVVNRALVQQYITNGEIVRKFCVYYDLYQKYKSDYQVDGILKGNYSEDLLEKAQAAKFDERISLLSLLIERLNEYSREAVFQNNVLETVVKTLRKMKGQKEKPLAELLSAQIQAEHEILEKNIIARSISTDGMREQKAVIRYYHEFEQTARKEKAEKQFAAVKKQFTSLVKQHEKSVASCQEMYTCAFGFVEQAWQVKQEMVLFLTELTANSNTMTFIELWGNESYFKFNQSLLVYDAKKKLQEEISLLDLI